MLKQQGKSIEKVINLCALKYDALPPSAVL